MSAYNSASFCCAFVSSLSRILCLQPPPPSHISGSLIRSPPPSHHPFSSASYCCEQSLSTHCIVLIVLKTRNGKCEIQYICLHYVLEASKQPGVFLAPFSSCLLFLSLFSLARFCGFVFCGEGEIIRPGGDGYTKGQGVRK